LVAGSIPVALACRKAPHYVAGLFLAGCAWAVFAPHTAKEIGSPEHFSNLTNLIDRPDFRLPSALFASDGIVRD